MQRENVLGRVLNLLEQQGLATPTLEKLAQQLGENIEDIILYWPNCEALIYDSLRYHAQQIDVWRRQILLDDTQTLQQKLLARYDVLTQHVKQQRYPGCLFIAACTAFPANDHPIHQLTEQQKQSSYEFTLTLLQELEIDDATMVAKQMELVLEGCLSKLLVKRSLSDVETARCLAEDILHIAHCRKFGALS